VEKEKVPFPSTEVRALQLQGGVCAFLELEPKLGQEGNNLNTVSCTSPQLVENMRIEARSETE